MPQGRSKAKKPTGFAEEPAAFGGVESLGEETLRARIEVGRGGRIVIPAAMRARMGIGEGSALVLLLKGEELEVFTPDAGIRRAQRLVRSFVPPGVSLVDELIEDRRRWAEEEEND